MTDQAQSPPGNVPEKSGEADPEGQLPLDFVDRLQKILAPVDFRAAMASFNGPRGVSFRINTLTFDVDPVVATLRNEFPDLVAVPWVQNAFTLPSVDRDRLLGSSLSSSGAVYLQNLASMIPPVVLDPQPGEEILDLTAAPGGKTHQMACAMENRGRITAVEAVRTRYYKLRDNMERLGAECARPFFQDGTRTWRYRPEFYDRVLLDAPCSSEGRFRVGDIDSVRYWSRRKVTEMSRKQRRLLYSGIMCLRVGGTLVYSTCSFSPEENEAVVHKLVKKFAGLVRLTSIGLALPEFRSGLTSWQGREFSEELALSRRVLPTDVMDGFFVCRLEKVGSTVA